MIIERTITAAFRRVSQDRSHSVPLTLLTLFGVMVLSKALGFLSQILITSLAGTSRQADTYYFASSIGNVLTALVISTAGSILIPLYVEKKEHESPDRANRYANAILTYLTLILASLSLLMAVLAGPLVGTLGQFPGELQPLATRVFAFTAPIALLTGTGQLLMALLQARKRFVAPALMGVLHSAVFIAVAALAWRKLGVYALILGVTTSMLLQAAVMLRQLAKEGKVVPALQFPLEEIRPMLALTWPLLFSQALSTVPVLTSRNIASGLVTGSVAALAYAESLKGVFLDLCVVPIAQISLPHFSERIARREDQGAWEQLQGALTALWFLVTPIVVFLLVLPKPLVQVFYQRGAFTTQSTALTASALAFFSLGLLGESGHYLVCRYFLALKDTHTLTWLGVPFTVLYIVLLLALSSVLSLRGVALSHSLVMIGNSAAALFALRKKVNRSFTPSFRGGVAKIVFAGLIMILAIRSVVAVLVTKLGDDFASTLLLLTIAGMTGIIGYLASALAAGITADVPLLLRLHPRRLLSDLTV